MQGEFKPVTKKQLALGALNTHRVYKDIDNERYMCHDEIVSFTISYQKNDFNWEYLINNLTYRKIWFSQLNKLFIADEGEEVYSGYIRLKNGEQSLLFQLDPYTFWQLVKDKKFRVSVCADKYAIDIWHPKCVNREYKDIIEEIFLALREERYDDMRGMTKPGIIYSFDEI